MTPGTRSGSSGPPDPDDAPHGRAPRAAPWLRRFPDGTGLTRADWASRHRWIMLAVWLHVPALLGFAFVGHDPLLTGATFPVYETSHVVLEVLPLLAFALLGSWPSASRRLRSLAASLALITSSALLTHFSGGYIEAHFHFFVVLGVIALYHDAVPFMVSILYVAIHHGVAGTLDPRAVYNHEAAWNHPWRWAVVHAVFVLALSIVELFHWRSTQQAHDRTALVLRSARDGIIGIGGDGHVTFANEAGADLVGLRGEDLTGRPARDVFARGLAQVIDANGAPRAAENATRLEARDVPVQRQDGALRWYDWTSDPVLQADLPGGCVVVLRDVTERREAERRVLEAQRMARLTSWSWDPNRAEPLHWAEGAAHLLGYAPDDVELRHPLRLVHPDDRERVAASLGEAAAGRPLSMSCRVVTRTGDTRSFHVRAHALAADGASVTPSHTVRLTGTIQDITERERVAQLEAEGQRQRVELDRLKRQDEFKNGIINNIAHELNTPLTPLRVQLHLLSKRAGQMDAAQRRALDMIERNMKRFDKLVQDMVETARIQNNRIRLHRAMHNLADLAGEAMSAFDAVATARNVKLVYAGPTELTAEVDGDRLLQVFYNLVSNAMKFAPDGGHIQLSGHEEGGFVSFHVDDSGPGLPPGSSAAMFQPFAQVESRNTAEAATGVGLGLFIARGLVERHGGRIWCRAHGALGGAHFGFTVPVEAVGDDENVSVQGTPDRMLGDEVLRR